MLTQTNSKIFVVTSQAEDAMALVRKRHYYPRIIPEFFGPISGPIFNSTGDMLYEPLQKKDKAIIPKAALSLHATVENAGFKVAQVIIGHEIVLAPQLPTVPAKPTTEIDWGNVAQVASKGLLVSMMGIAMIPLFALTGLVTLLDPSYCIVMHDGAGTVIELLNWNAEP